MAQQVGVNLLGHSVGHSFKTRVVFFWFNPSASLQVSKYHNISQVANQGRDLHTENQVRASNMMHLFPSAFIFNFALDFQEVSHVLVIKDVCESTTLLTGSKLGKYTSAQSTRNIEWLIASVAGTLGV